MKNLNNWSPTEDFSSSELTTEKVYVDPKDTKAYLTHHHSFRYNTIKGRVEVLLDDTWRLLDDRIFHSILQNINDAGGKLSEQHLHSILTSNFVESFDPFEEYFTNLPKVPSSPSYIDEIADRVVTKNQQYWRKCFKKWLVASVACSLDKKAVNHTVLILQGTQGLGKTTFLEKLRPSPLVDYYYSGEINPSNKDTLINLSECLFINLDELGSLNRKSESALKEIITKSTIRIRRPYARYADTLPRRASFFGSVNSLQVLSDSTGSRRFLIHQVENIDYQTPIDLDRLWAEAHTLFTSGYKYYFDQDEIKEINQANREFEITNPEEESLLRYYKPWDGKLEGECRKLTATEILRNLNGGKLPSNSQGSAIKLGKALSKHWFEYVTIRSEKKYLLQTTGNPVWELKNKL